MRVSDYFVQVPLEQEFHLLFHTYTGAVDVVSQETVSFLNDFSNSVDGGDAKAVALLKQRGYLTDRTPQEEEEFVARLGALLHERAKSQRPHSFMIIPTYNCNLRCPYCYEKSLQKHGRSWLEKTMDREMIDKVFGAITSLDCKQRAHTIGLYGGEPFLPENFDSIAYLLEKGNNLGYAFNAVTNGSELRRYLPVLKQIDFTNVQITLDGPKRIHDQRRYRVGGEGTFDAISANIDDLLASDIGVNLRINVDRSNLEYVRELAQYVEDQGWPTHSKFTAACAHVLFCTSRNSDGLGLSRLQLFDALKPIKRDFPWLVTGTRTQTIKSVLKKALDDQLVSFTSWHCGSEVNMLLFDSHGDIYVCWESIGLPEGRGRVGRFLPEITWEEQALEAWRSRTISQIEECKSCKYALICGGGCAQKALDEKGSLNSSYCDYFEEIFLQELPVLYEEVEAEQQEQIASV